jgi:hypothetical protein
LCHRFASLADFLDRPIGDQRRLGSAPVSTVLLSASLEKEEPYYTPPNIYSSKKVRKRKL